MSRPVSPVAPEAAKRRGRRTRRILISLAVLVAILVGADFGLAAFAEHTVSQKARQQLGLTDDPSVTIHGFPFITQALSGDYSRISVSASGVPIQNLKDVDINAELKDVTAPLSDLMNGNTSAILVGKLEAQVTIKASDIAKIDPLTRVEDLRIEPSSVEYVQTGQDAKDSSGSDQDGKQQEEEQDKSKAGIRVSGYVQIAGQKIEIFCFAMIELHGTSIDIVPKRLQYGNDKETTVVPQAVQQALLPNFKATFDTGDLPFAVTPTAVQVNSGSVTVKGEAQNVKFTGR
ncbi:LmeA family phospholipid-binding protein [Amycolatopsis taiwanensis]|uniref:DUF2993 domain-containing protein n=1 Tax=Amycolatopsis taiwanensis TaxID=342230 RepID=A0A9W6VHG4_9PSEU|nr:DUF2993 domain-containing protein [Amycolatopsis taiwanensis]GLY67417.1 hypothetical protein Atai01_40360 [Amycolatopsis taiwanensis]